MRPYTALAQALDATGARIEAVRNALDQAEARRQDGVTKEPPGLAKVALALRTGDFVGAEAALAALVPTLKDSTEQDHDSLAALQIAVAEETGNRAKALQIGLEFASGSRAWTQNAPLGVRTKVLYLRHEAGTMNDAAFEAARARHLVEQYKLLGTVSAERKDYWRLLIDARYGETPAEAKVALPADREVLPTLSPFELHEHAADYGRLLLLAGRIDPAVTALENQTKRCEGLPTALSVDLSKLDVILDYVHAHVLLGQALEARKDKDGACRAYRVVESRWKDAKPRSVTLEKAKERLRALACPAPH
jgi:hypothetical protein